MLKNWSKVKMYDLSQPLSHLTPPWPTYEPLEIKFFKRLCPNGANGQVLTHSNHVGTHLDGPLHFCTHGDDIASLPLDFLVGPGVVVDLSDIAEDYGFYSSKDITDRVEVKEGDILIIHTGYHHYSWDQPAADEVRYMVKHPGPTREFADWCMQMKIKWIGVDCGFAMAAALAIVQFVGGMPQDALNFSNRMYEITLGESSAYSIPIFDFRGTPTGIDVRKVIETGILPQINTGIAHRQAGVGQVGAGLVSPPWECFAKAIQALAAEYGGTA